MLQKLKAKLKAKFMRMFNRDFQMKLFVWKDVLEIYEETYFDGAHMYYGQMIAFAPDVETARNLLRKELDRPNDPKCEAELAREPEVYIINTFAAAIWGYPG